MTVPFASTHSSLPDSVITRFLTFAPVGNRDACWLWTGPIVNGYGRLFHWVDTRKRRKTSFGAHRVSLMLSGLAIPRGLCVLHSCDTPRCVNPAHLRVGTQADNNRDARERGRAVKPPIPKRKAAA